MAIHLNGPFWRYGGNYSIVLNRCPLGNKLIYINGLKIEKRERVCGENDTYCTSVLIQVVPLKRKSVAHSANWFMGSNSLMLFIEVHTVSARKKESINTHFALSR